METGRKVKAPTIKPEQIKQEEVGGTCRRSRLHQDYSTEFYKRQEKREKKVYIKKTNNPKMGRPVEGSSLIVDLKVRIDTETHELLQSFCRENNMNKAEVARAAIKEYLEKHV